jgi:hypothetical protein
LKFQVSLSQIIRTLKTKILMSGLNSRSSLAKLGSQKQMKPIKIMVLGQTAVGKSGECIE